MTEFARFAHKRHELNDGPISALRDKCAVITQCTNYEKKKQTRPVGFCSVLLLFRKLTRKKGFNRAKLPFQQFNRLTENCLYRERKTLSSDNMVIFLDAFNSRQVCLLVIDSLKVKCYQFRLCMCCLHKYANFRDPHNSLQSDQKHCILCFSTFFISDTSIKYHSRTNLQYTPTAMNLIALFHRGGISVKNSRYQENARASRATRGPCVSTRDNIQSCYDRYSKRSLSLFPCSQKISNPVEMYPISLLASQK